MESAELVRTGLVHWHMRAECLQRQIIILDYMVLPNTPACAEGGLSHCRTEQDPEPVHLWIACLCMEACGILKLLL